jgi:hypothetical protein
VYGLLILSFISSFLFCRTAVLCFSDLVVLGMAEKRHGLMVAATSTRAGRVDAASKSFAGGCWRTGQLAGLGTAATAMTRAWALFSFLFLISPRAILLVWN